MVQLSAANESDLQLCTLGLLVVLFGGTGFFGGWLFFLFLFLMAQKSPSPHAVSMRKKLSTATRSARIGGYTPRVCVVHIYELCGTVVHTTCTHMAIRARTLSYYAYSMLKSTPGFFFGWPHSQEAHLPLPSQPEEAIWHNTSTTTQYLLLSKTNNSRRCLGKCHLPRCCQRVRHHSCSAKCRVELKMLIRRLILRLILQPKTILTKQGG